MKSAAMGQQFAKQVVELAMGPNWVFRSKYQPGGVRAPQRVRWYKLEARFIDSAVPTMEFLISKNL